MKKNFLMDMDGVLVHGSRAITGADKFLRALAEDKREFAILTNNSKYTTRDLAHRLNESGLKVNENRIFTSAIATASFLARQGSKGTAFVIGEAGLIEAIHTQGFIQTDINPEFVVLGETMSYSLDQITIAIRLINQGARFIATNPDPSGPSENGIVPATGAMAALIEKATGKEAFFVGKPNPLMMRTALNHFDMHSENTYMVGDRMDTDILSGISAGMDTILVLSGSTHEKDIDKFPYRPMWIRKSVAHIDLSEFE
ncbi:MAG TPA: HAD-IIA family hydrolase [Anaerolineaceae bacterium]|jgi:NagD protein|nr:HAD-IIA family hydrolase [Anaerolineaceae bacterium]